MTAVSARVRARVAARFVVGALAVPVALVVLGVAACVYRHAQARRCTNGSGWRGDA
jgi:hypothetical protein